MADDLDMSGLRLSGMPDAETPTIVNIDQSDVGYDISLLSPHEHNRILSYVM